MNIIYGTPTRLLNPFEPVPLRGHYEQVLQDSHGRAYFTGLQVRVVPMGGVYVMQCRGSRTAEWLNVTRSTKTKGGNVATLRFWQRQGNALAALREVTSKGQWSQVFG